MAKVIKYNMQANVNHGTKENPLIEVVLFPVIMDWNETNEEIAKREAYNGEYTIEENDQPAAPRSSEERIAELEEMMNALLGVSE